ncbi:hypothetical protein RchiOBHm_Chr3g0485361 [Rosa chinensis]|uniref:Uncharacterized protein n=1 Tax=Rosa chinensis TaxID=74649 RepID=A0A2P6REY5_ROSCH|nr:hypothetical protein RchiOBHm_Chr3g0485361 [Rosa chinensis]
MHKSSSIARMMVCYSCFGFFIARDPKLKMKPNYSYSSHPSQEHLLDDALEDDDTRLLSLNLSVPKSPPWMPSCYNLQPATL